MFIVGHCGSCDTVHRRDTAVMRLMENERGNIYECGYCPNHPEGVVFNMAYGVSGDE